VGAFALRYFTEWFDMAYPGDKLDLVAIPDFAFGAMENLGCVTFRERYVLVDEVTSTQAERQAVVDVIAHEIAHMWFGDLVTMKWWNGIWLNEAFATFMEITCTDAFRPDWQRWVEFGLSRSAAFDTDALGTTRPIEYPVVSPADAEGMFDVLTYEKGASVVRMLEQYLGADRFRAGIRRYMARHQYGNTETSDLWEALEAETGEPVRRIAESWIFQGGFPEVHVERGPGRTFRFAQRRFGYDVADDGSRWAIPLVTGHRDGDGARASTGLLDDDELELGRGHGQPVEPLPWLNANFGANGFYRVRYEKGLLDALLDNLTDLTPLERYTLVDDAWAEVLAGTTEAAAFVEVAERFAGDDDLSVWERLVGGLAQLDRLVEGKARRRLHERVDALLAPARERLGPDPSDAEDDRSRSLRGTVLQASALLGNHGPSIDRSAELLERFLAAPGDVDPNLSAAALTVTATLGDAALHDLLVEHLRTTGNPQDRQRIQFSLTRFRDPGCLARTLELTLSADVRTQDAPYLVRDALANRDNATLAWRFASGNWSEMEDRFPANSIPRMLGGIRAIRDRALADEVAAFVARHPVPQGELQVRQHLERMWVTVGLAEREAGPLTDALTR
jgi:puromycin-sensitive aminopeptidase